MTQEHRTAKVHEVRDMAIATAKLVGVFALLAVLAHVSWNMFAPDLFGLPEIRFKQALGLVVFAGIFSLLLRHPFGRQHHG